MAKYKIERVNFKADSLAADKISKINKEARTNQGEPLKYFVQTFGCQQNESDSEKLCGILQQLGYTEAAAYEEADLVLINTCSIRENADQRLFGHLGRLKALRETRPDLKVGVCGCLPTQPEQMAKIRQSFSYVNLIFGPQDIHRLPQLLSEMYEANKTVSSVSEDNIVCEEVPVQRERKFRALVSIMYGCNNFCTYCMVPSSRERERSRSWQDIYAECQEVASSGIPEVMLLGQNVNAWGFDFRERAKSQSSFDYTAEDENLLLRLSEGQTRGIEINSFPRLLALIASIPGIQSIRYMSPHPRDFGGEMLAALKVIPQIENHIHLPLQAGSNAVLKKMNRHYDSARYLELVSELRKVRPGIAITTDIMVGFPGESAEDFEQTLKVVEEAKFASAFSFIYSERPGTVAATWEQIPMEIRHARFNRLLELLNHLSRAENESIRGTKRMVLIEGLSKNDPSILTARDSEFHLLNLHITDPASLPPEAFDVKGDLVEEFFEGRFALARITLAKTYSVEGDLLELR